MQQVRKSAVISGYGSAGLALVYQGCCFSNWDRAASLDQSRGCGRNGQNMLQMCVIHCIKSGTAIKTPSDDEGLLLKF